MARIRPIPSLDGKYGCDKDGNIYRLLDHYQQPLDEPRPIKPMVNSATGYRFFNSYVGKHATPYVHHVVAEAWHGPRPADHDIHHRDGIKINCSAKNLRYVPTAKHRRMNTKWPDSFIEQVIKAKGTMFASKAARRFGLSEWYVRTLWSGRRRCRNKARWVRMVEKLGLLNRKLTEEQVREIRLSPLSHRMAAKEYGVHAGTIQRIRRRRLWKWVA